jgi:hypothetical protein
MGKWLDRVAAMIARHLEESETNREIATRPESTPSRLSLQPGDVLLVEGAGSISSLIKYVTQSTWTHAAIYVGPVLGKHTESGEPHVLVEANIGEGVVTAPLSKYRNCATRVCRPVGLTQGERQFVCSHVIGCIGLEYDVKNIIDLARYLLPLPASRNWRRRTTTLGSRDPRRIICSALIAQAFQRVRFPILASGQPHAPDSRHPSLYTPCDFDVSPYFAVVKPPIESSFHQEASAIR